MALITVARAAELIPNWQAADNTVMTDIVNAASDVVVRYCNRDFALTTYDELYDGTGAYNLLVNQYPLTQVLRISFALANVIQIRMTDQVVSRASVRLDGTTDVPPKPNNLYLVSLKNGVETDITIGPLTGASPTVTVNGSPTGLSQMQTMTDLCNVVNTYGAAYGWSAAGLGVYTTWPLADLRPPQGALECRWFGNAYLTLHTWNMPIIEQRPETGEIVSPMAFDLGYQNYRVIYQAGYTTIPNPIQQATAALAVSVYQARNQNANLQSENLGGYSYAQIADKNFHSLDIASRFGLPLFKNYRVAKFKIY